MKNIQKTQKEMEAELAKILTPEELENYQLRLSQTAIRTVFGEKAFNSYVNQPGIYWLKGISPDPKPTTPCRFELHSFSFPHRAMWAKLTLNYGQTT